jgi:hypothetical protein
VVDEAVVAPPDGSLEKLAVQFDKMADKADELVLNLLVAKVRPSKVLYAKEFQDRFNDRNGTFKKNIEDLRDDCRAIAKQLRKVAKTYKDTEFDNKDDIDRLRDLVDNLKAHNPGIDKIMPVVPTTPN